LATAVNVEFFTIRELVERWRVTRTTIYREVKRGKLKRTLVAGSVRFSRDQVEEYERLMSS